MKTIFKTNYFVSVTWVITCKLSRWKAREKFVFKFFFQCGMRGRLYVRITKLVKFNVCSLEFGLPHEVFKYFLSNSKFHLGTQLTKNPLGLPTIACRLNLFTHHFFKTLRILLLFSTSFIYMNMPVRTNE